MPFDFQQLANFRLARGSHKQPNKGGNICVNEAAVIAAGFQYREIRDVSCLPDCFSRPVSEYAIYLNDFMMHRVRNELLVPFITRLPGTSDAPWVEEERVRLIVVETVRRIVAAEYDERDAQPDRTLVKEADFEVVREWKLHLRPSRAAAAKLAKPLGDVALEPYAHEISGLRRRRDAARAPQCGLETQ